MRLVSEWSGKEIVFPNDMEFTSLGNDTNYLFKNEYTVMTYVDSIGCTGCKLKLPQWKELNKRIGFDRKYVCVIFLISQE